MFEKKLDYYDYNSFLFLKDKLNIEFLDRFYDHKITFIENDNFYNNYFIGLFYLKYFKNKDPQLSKIYLKYFFKNKDCGNCLLDEIYLSRLNNDIIKKGIYLNMSNNNSKYYDLYNLYKNIDTQKSEKFLNKGIKVNDVYCLYEKTKRKDTTSKYILYIKLLDILKGFEHTDIYINIDIEYYIYKLKTRQFGLCNTIKTLDFLAQKHKSGKAYFALFEYYKDQDNKTEKIFIDEEGFCLEKYKTSSSILFCDSLFSKKSIHYLLNSQKCSNFNLYAKFKDDVKYNSPFIYLNLIRFSHNEEDETILLNQLKEFSSKFIVYNKEKILKILLHNIKYINLKEFMKLSFFLKTYIVDEVDSILGKKRKRINI